MKIFISIFIVLVLSTELSAQKFSSLMLESISERISPKLNYRGKWESKIVDTELFKEHKIRILKRGDGTIYHIGLELFHDADSIQLTPNLLFIERELLHLYLADSYEEESLFIASHRLVLLLNGDDFMYGNSWMLKQAINNLSRYTEFEAQENGGHYFISWKGDFGELLMQYPADIQIIEGMDKRELDKNFQIAQLSKDTISDGTALAPYIQGEDLNLMEDGTLLLKRGKYLIDDLNRDLFYCQGDDDKYILLDNENNPGRSFRNLFYQDNERTREIKLILEQRLYNSDKRVLELSLGAFVRSMSRQHQIYSGIEEIKGDRLKLTIICSNISENYNHVLEVISEKQELFQKDNGVVAAKIRTFIPVNNRDYRQSKESSDRDVPKYEVKIKKKHDKDKL